MKARKKPHGMKHRIREEKKREERIRLVVAVVIMSILIFLSGYLVNSFLNQSSTDQTANSEPKAAIVDQASLSPAGGFNKSFVEQATDMMKRAGYDVDYIKGEDVTVEFYRNLATYGYGLIVLRVHSGTNPKHGWVVPFSSESYSKAKYVYEQLTDKIIPTAYNYPLREGEPVFFGMTPSFVTSSMNGRFQNTIVIMMGCNGLEYPSMAKAFVEKGAKAYVGWDKAIYFSHTDAATIRLLHHLLEERQTIGQAVEKTVKETGPDPLEDSLLTYYPLEAGDYAIQNIVGNLITSDMVIQHKDLGETKHQEIS